MNMDHLTNSITLYQPCDFAQGLLHENASCLAVRTHLVMREIPFKVKFRSNAEFMAFRGRLSKLPLLKVGVDAFAEFQPIAVRITETMGTRMEEVEDELFAYLTWVENTFTLAEIYVSFMDKKVFEKVTSPRIKYAFPWPLSTIRVKAKRRQCLRVLRCYQWYDLSKEEVIEKLEQCCEALTEKLKESGMAYFGGEQPCELDALVFGHLFTILTTRLGNEMLAETVVKYESLAEYCRFIEGKYYKRGKSGSLIRKE